MARSKQAVPTERIQNAIILIRGQKVMLDRDLANLYGVPTKRLNEQVKRNIDRFPEEFMFRLTKEEAAILKSQVATSKTGRGGRRTSPYAFTEHGTLMLASVLNSPQAIAVSIQVVRVFVQLRQMLSTHADLARKLAALENKYDTQFKAVFDAIRELMKPDVGTGRKIGFHQEK